MARFGEVSFDLPRMRCKACGLLFNLQTGTLSDLQALRNANITPALRRIAIRCAAAWPYRQAQQTIVDFTGVSISHEQIRQLCADEAKKVHAKHEVVFQQAYSQSLVETVEVLVEYISSLPWPEPLKPPAIDESQRVYFGIDGTFINAKEVKQFFEAKAAIVFTNDIAIVGKNRRMLLNKQYVGTLESVDVFSEKLFTTARAMGIDNQHELVILSDGARWITKLAKTQYPKATLILDWWHLDERVWETVNWLKLNGLNPKPAREFGRRLIDLLWRGKAKETWQSIVILGKHLGLEPPAKRSQVELGERSLQALYQYIKNNIDAVIDYHTFKRAGYYIGSVVAEKTIDLLVCRRQKLRGQNWSREGADNVLTFRTMILNGHWESYWQQRKAA